MANLFFYYSSMNAGKSTNLLQADFNYREKGMHTLLLNSAFDTRYKVGRISSRIGISAPCLLFEQSTDLLNLIINEEKKNKFDIILIDEAQFLTKRQVWQLCNIIDRKNIPILCYGLRTDFQGNLFEGAQWLLAWSDKIIELKTICSCGRKATMTLRIDQDGNPVHQGKQIQVGDKEHYISVCRKHFRERDLIF